MIYSAVDVSNYILYYYKHNKDLYINNLRLQRLLYYCQANYLVKNNRPLFSEEFLAWDIGPVIKNIYRRYKAFGSANIPADTIIEEDFRSINDTDRKIINNLLDKCMEYNGNELMRITVKESAWKEIYQIHRENVISNDKIKEFFIE